MNILDLFDAIRAAKRMSAALAGGRRPDPIDVEQLGLTDVMQRTAASQRVWKNGSSPR